MNTETRTAVKRTGPRAQLRVDEVEAIRHILETGRREALTALDVETRSGRDLAEGWTENDSPAEAQLRELGFGHVERLLRRIREIDHAIDRIDDGSYGLCVACGRRIGKNRLSLDPAAALCFSCRKAEEGPSPIATL